MQDEKVTCHDLGKVSFECDRLFRNLQTRARDSFPKAPTRARDSFSNVPIRARDHNLDEPRVELIVNLPLLLLAMYPHIH